MKRALLDENIPRGLTGALRLLGIAAESFPNDWKGLSNGKLLDRLRSTNFDVLVTADSSIAYQQALRDRRIGIVSLPTNKRRVLISPSEGHCRRDCFSGALHLHHCELERQTRLAATVTQWPFAGSALADRPVCLARAHPPVSP